MIEFIGFPDRPCCERMAFHVPMPGTHFATVGTKPRSGDSHRVCTVLLPINLVIESYSELLPLLAVMQFGRKCWKGNVFRGKGINSPNY